MNYYYADSSNQAVGPVSEGALHDLFRTGRITLDSLVTTEGETDWKEYRTLQSSPSASPPPLPPPTTAPKSLSATPSAQPQRRDFPIVPTLIVVLAASAVLLLMAVATGGYWYFHSRNSSRTTVNRGSIESENMKSLKFSTLRWYTGSNGIPNQENELSLELNYKGELCMNNKPLSDSTNAKNMNWFRAAIEDGDPEALNNSGVMHALGKGAPKDEAKAIELFETASKRGSVAGWDNFVIMYEHSNHVPQEESKAFEWFQKAAEKGDPSSQMWLGAYYASSNQRRSPGFYDKPSDPRIAQRFPAIGTVGIATERSVPRDIAKAAKWYDDPALLGFANAQFSLAALYRISNHPKKDLLTSVWYLMASKGGHKYALRQLRKLDMANQAEVEQTAAKISKVTSDLHKENAQDGLKLGNAQDGNKLVDSYQKAAMRGDPVAQYNLAVMYEYGIIVPKDSVRALAWYSVFGAYSSSNGTYHVEPLGGFFLEDQKSKRTPNQRAQAAKLTDELLKQIYSG